MSDTGQPVEKTRYLLNALSWMLANPDARGKYLPQIMDASRGRSGGLQPDSNIMEIVDIYRAVMEGVTLSLRKSAGTGSEKNPIDQKTEKRLKTLIETGLFLDVVCPMSDLPVRTATLIRAMTKPEEQVKICRWMGKLPEKFSSRPDATFIREEVAATLLHVWVSHEKNQILSDEVQKILEEQLGQMSPGSLERIVGRQILDSHLTFSAPVAGLLMASRAGGKSREGESDAFPIGEIRRELKEYMQRYPGRVGREHFELARQLTVSSRNPANTKNLTADLSDELFPVIYKTLLSPGMSPQVRAEGYALVSQWLTEGQRQMIWEIQLESLPYRIPPEKEYWSLEMRKGIKSVETMVSVMEIPELIERMQKLPVVIRDSLSPEAIVPVISRLGAALQETPAYAEPPSRIMVRELLSGLPAEVRRRPEVACHEPPENEVALSWEFVRDCLSRGITLPVWPSGDDEAKIQSGDWLQHFPRTSRDGMTHLGNVAELVMRQAGAGNQSWVRYAYEVLPLLVDAELKKRLFSPEVQSAITSHPALGTVVFFEIRRREELAAGNPEKPEWETLRTQLQATGALPGDALPEQHSFPAAHVLSPRVVQPERPVSGYER